jgi:deoxyadenosine/deoxycytidine kinase
MKLFSIEGNIGSGKSTLIEKLNDISGAVFLPEPVDIWNEIKDTNGVTILEKYYADNERYAFSFQMMAYISRLTQIRNNSNCEILITERSVLTDYNVFAKMLYDAGKIAEIEFLIYKKWFDEFLKDLPTPKIIYIKTSPETCLQRVKKRNRKGETIPLGYLRDCHNYHENWINGFSDKLVLDGEKENSDDSVLLIKEFVKKQ